MQDSTATSALKSAFARVDSARGRLNERLPDAVEVGYLTIRVRTKRGKRFVDRLAEHETPWNLWHTIGIGVGVLLGAFALLLFGVAVAIYAAVKVPEPSPVMQAHNMVVVPGVNDALPWSTAPAVVVALVAGATVHELGHAIAARTAGIEVEEMGALFLGPLPLGAYVKPDSDALEDASNLAQLRVFCAGVMNNTALAVLLTPIVFSPFMPDVSTMIDAYLTALQSGGQNVNGVAQIPFVANTVFLAWILNLNLGPTNMLPIYGLDGWHTVRIVTEAVASRLPDSVTEPLPVSMQRGVLAAISVATLFVVGVAVAGPHAVHGGGWL